MLKLIDRSEWSKEGVPEHLQHAVAVLNEVNGLAAKELASLMHKSTWLSGNAQAFLLGHPTVVLCGSLDAPALSVLGLLNGVLATQEFRIAGYCVTGDTYDEFVIVKIVRAQAQAEK